MCTMDTVIRFDVSRAIHGQLGQKDLLSIISVVAEQEHCALLPQHQMDHLVGAASIALR